MSDIDGLCFEQTRGVSTLYCSKEGDSVDDCRFALARYGEDADLVLQKFWEERPSGNFTVVPIFAHGLPPRRKLCTQRSLVAALQTVTLEPGSRVEQQWKEVADALHVSWPKRFRANAA